MPRKVYQRSSMNGDPHIKVRELAAYEFLRNAVLSDDFPEDYGTAVRTFAEIFVAESIRRYGSLYAAVIPLGRKRPALHGMLAKWGYRHTRDFYAAHGINPTIRGRSRRSSKIEVIS